MWRDLWEYLTEGFFDNPLQLTTGQKFKWVGYWLAVIFLMCFAVYFAACTIGFATGNLPLWE